MEQKIKNWVVVKVIYGGMTIGNKLENLME